MRKACAKLVPKTPMDVQKAHRFEKNSIKFQFIALWRKSWAWRKRVRNWYPKLQWTIKRQGILKKKHFFKQSDYWLRDLVRWKHNIRASSGTASKAEKRLSWANHTSKGYSLSFRCKGRGVARQFYKWELRRLKDLFYPQIAGESYIASSPGRFWQGTKLHLSYKSSEAHSILLSSVHYHKLR